MIEMIEKTSISPDGLSDKDLHQMLVHLKSKESHVVAQIISHLQEVYRRRLFADFGCSSIYDYCIRILGYSNGEAHKKISACKLASQVRGVRESIATGEMSLSNAASVQSLVAKLQKPSLTPSQINKAAQEQERPTSNSALVHSIVERVKNKTTRDCEKELHKIAEELNLEVKSPAPSRRNLNDLAQLKVCVNRENLDSLKLEMGMTNEQELIDCLISERLNQLLEKKKSLLQTEVVSRPHKPHSKPRSISPSKRAIVMKKADGKCENCEAATHLQIDHKQSVARGGGNELKNLRILCRSCNQRSAIQELGLKKMEPYLRRQSLSKEKPLKRNSAL